MGADNPRVGVSGAPLGRDGNQDTEAVRNHEGGLSPSTRPPVSLCQSLCLRSCPSPVCAHLLHLRFANCFLCFCRCLCGRWWGEGCKWAHHVALEARHSRTSEQTRPLTESPGRQDPIGQGTANITAPLMLREWGPCGLTPENWSPQQGYYRLFDAEQRRPPTGTQQ